MMAAIDTIKDLVSIRDKLKNEIELATSKLEIINQTLSILGFTDRHTEDSTYSIIDLIDIEDKEFPKNGTISDKIIFVLKRLGNASAEEIADYIIKTQGTTDTVKIDRIRKSVSLISSSIFKQGEIKATKEGKKNIYHL